ncbi:MAG TPA: hypothetical protein DEB40_03595 [Elusimicrobia bacterium]|nr:hypothetical protein [Elusimicrobiota bacterium]HBT60810.1 hypothetical protein [Elusimicrobiota bacterium]
MFWLTLASLLLLRAHGQEAELRPGLKPSDTYTTEKISALPPEVVASEVKGKGSGKFPPSAEPPGKIRKPASSQPTGGVRKGPKRLKIGRGASGSSARLAARAAQAVPVSVVARPGGFSALPATPVAPENP